MADHTLAWNRVVDVAVVADVNADEWLVCQSPRHRNSVYEMFDQTYCSCRDGMMLDDAAKRSRICRDCRFSVQNPAYCRHVRYNLVRALTNKVESREETRLEEAHSLKSIYPF